MPKVAKKRNDLIEVRWSEWLRTNYVMAIAIATAVVSVGSWGVSFFNSYYAKEWHGPTSIQQVIQSVAQTQAQIDRTDAGLARISDGRLLAEWTAELAKMKAAGYTPDTVPSDWFTEAQWNNWIYIEEEAKTIIAKRRAQNLKTGAAIDHSDHGSHVR